jgi:putative transposase
MAGCRNLLDTTYCENDLHFLTTSIPQGGTARRFRFRLLGYVLMPEHFHLLVWPSDGADPSQIMQRLKGRTARSILKTLRPERRHAWCARILRRFSLPPTVHDEAGCRVWQRRFYDMNIWTEKKQLEKLDYMHNNPVVRKLVDQPGDWPWSSWRFYFLEDESVMAMDRLP